MAPQKVETVEQPEMTDSGWEFPKHWTDDEINDWLVTHPIGVETIAIADDGGVNGDGDEPGPDDDRDEYEKAYDQQEASEAEVISALKADGMLYAAMAVPMELRDTVNSENYDPREFFLVHADVWNEMVSATVAEAELGLENKELRKRVNALTRGMRKVNKHWSVTKRELKVLKSRYKQTVESWQAYARDEDDRHRDELKRKDIFATRLARRLRKARAGRDKRERQLQQANMAIAAQDQIMARQDEYISHLEKLLGTQIRR